MSETEGELLVDYVGKGKGMGGSGGGVQLWSRDGVSFSHCSSTTSPKAHHGRCILLVKPRNRVE